MIYIYFADKRKRMIVFEIVRVQIHTQKGDSSESPFSFAFFENSLYRLMFGRGYGII